MQKSAFPYIAKPNATVLILGTMPGERSLVLDEYYGHPQNAFWKIMFALFDKPVNNDYTAKKKLLLSNKIALWDVLQFCERKGSLDSAIKNEVPNDFEAFFNAHPHIKVILFNGKKAAHFFKKYVGEVHDIKLITLPSTSPANARMRFDEKLKEWSVIMEKSKP